MSPGGRRVRPDRGGVGNGSAPSEGARSLRRSPCDAPARLRSTFAGKLRSGPPPACAPPRTTSFIGCLPDPWRSALAPRVLFGFNRGIPARRFEMIRKIQHIGVAVRSLSDAIPFYRDVLGLELLGIEEVAEQKVRTAIFRVGESTIEVLETTSPDGPVGKFLEKNGEGIHHLCLGVDDAATALAHAKEKGVRLIDETPRTGVHGMKIGFLHPKSTFGVLTEFAQEGEEP